MGERGPSELEEFRRYQHQVENTAQADLKNAFVPVGRAPLNIWSRENIPLGNEWLTALEEQERTVQEVPQKRNYRRIIPTFYTWDEYRVFLHLIRVEADYETVIKTVIEEAPMTDGEIFIYSVFEGTDHLMLFQEEHLRVEENIFLICVPHDFAVRVHSESPFIPDFVVHTSPLHTAGRLKKLVNQRRGFPKNRIDLIFDGQCMENAERLLHYDVRNESVINLIVQTGIRRKVKIITFWQRVYYIEVDITQTATEVITMVIKLCAAHNIGELVIKENYIEPRQLLLMTPGNKVIGLRDCIYRYLEDEKVNHLMLVERTNPLQDTIIEVLGFEHGPETVVVSDGAKYVSAYLKLHGMTDIPINRMSLLGFKRNLNPYDVVNVERDGSPIKVIVQSKMVDPHTLTVNLVLPTMVVFRAHLKSNDNIEQVKRELDNYGFPEVMQYYIYFNNKHLKDDVILYLAGVKEGDYLHLVSHRYYVHVVATRGQMSKISVHAHAKVDSILRAGDDIYLQPGSPSKYIFCGDIVQPGVSTDKMELWPGNFIHQELHYREIIMEIVMPPGRCIHFHLLRNSIGFRLRESLVDWHLPRHVVDGLEQLLIWRITKPSPTEKIEETEVSMLDAYYATDVKKKKAIAAFKHPKLTEKGRRKKGISKQNLLLGEAEPVMEYTPLDMPTMVLYSKPKALSYDTVEGLPSLMYKNKNASQL